MWMQLPCRNMLAQVQHYVTGHENAPWKSPLLTKLAGCWLLLTKHLMLGWFAAFSPPPLRMPCSGDLLAHRVVCGPWPRSKAAVVLQPPTIASQTLVMLDVGQGSAGKPATVAGVVAAAAAAADTRRGAH